MPAADSYQKTVLPSGMRVVTERIPNVRSASLGVWVNVGSRNESSRNNGISHFIEHMAFKGTSTRSALDIARTIEKGGGYINAFTSKELTCFYVHVLDERLPIALQILADILRDSVYDPAEMEKEKQVILDEIRDHEDMPDDVAHEKFVASLFASHPLAMPILGPPENVRGFTRERLLEFIRRQYLPRRVVVAAAGNIRHERVLKQVEQLLDFRNNGSLPSEKPVGRMRPAVDRNSRPIQQAHMVIGTRGLPYADRSRFTLTVLNTILGGGMSSRLFQNIRERHGVAYSIYSFAEMLKDTGLWGVYVATDKSRVDRARELVLAELAALRERPVPAEEIAGVKLQIKGNMMLGLENVSSRMMRLARMEIYLKRFHTLDDIAAQIDAVTARKVRDLAAAMFDERNLITTIVEPAAKRSARANRTGAGRKNG